MQRYSLLKGFDQNCSLTNQRRPQSGVGAQLCATPFSYYSDVAIHSTVCFIQFQMCFQTCVLYVMEWQSVFVTCLFQDALIHSLPMFTNCAGWKCVMLSCPVVKLPYSRAVSTVNTKQGSKLGDLHYFSARQMNVPTNFEFLSKRWRCLTGSVFTMGQVERGAEQSRGF